MSLESIIERLGDVRVVPHRTGDSAALSLAIDRVLLRRVEREIKQGIEVHPIVRTHQFSKPAVILGWNQQRKGYVNDALAEQYGVDITQRDTGGGHMFYGSDDMQFSLVCPMNLFHGRDPIQGYHHFNTLVVEALQQSGYDGVCLGNTSVRIDDGETKRILAGTAKRMGTKAYLHQGGILVQPYTDETFDLLEASGEERTLWDKHVTTLHNWPQGNPTAFPLALQELFPNKHVKDVTGFELREAQTLVESTYANAEHLSSGKKRAYICYVAGLMKDPFSTHDTEQVVPL